MGALSGTGCVSVARRFAIALCLVAITGLSACSTNRPANADLVLASKPAPGTDYSFSEWLKSQPNDLGSLVVISFSGGGVRAASLAVGSLEALHDRRLDSQIGLISSTSGGSVASAMYAAKGANGLAQLNESFLANDNMSRLAPKLLPLIPVPGANRSAAFADFLEERLFAGGPLTFRELIPRWKLQQPSPFVIFNATDMSAGRNFEFTQEMLSNLCTDLGQLRISQAVTASAAFPFLINPVPLRNYSTPDCRKNVSLDANEEIQHWAEHKYLYLDQLERARYLQSLQYPYAGERDVKDAPDRKVEFIHLLDGGLADNLAIRAVLRAIGENYDLLKEKHVRSILLVQVNARSSKPNAIDLSGDIPSLLDVFWSVTLNPIDIASELSAYAAREYLVQLAHSGAQGGDVAADAISIYPALVDFGLIEDSARRHQAQHIDTSWTLPGRKSDLLFLKTIAKEQIDSNPCLLAFERAMAGEQPDPNRKCEFIQLTGPGVPAGGRFSHYFPPPAPVAAPRPPPPSPPPPSPSPGFKITFQSDVFFRFDKAELQRTGKAVLDDFAAMLIKLDVESIKIVGHTDSVGNGIYNKGLSLARAEAVRDYLASRLPHPTRLLLEGRGKDDPASDNATAAGRAKNRRVEVEVNGERRR